MFFRKKGYVFLIQRAMFFEKRAMFFEKKGYVFREKGTCFFTCKGLCFFLKRDMFFLKKGYVLGRQKSVSDFLQKSLEGQPKMLGALLSTVLQSHTRSAIAQQE